MLTHVSRRACAVLLLSSSVLSARARAADANNGPLVLYSAQHPQMVDGLTSAFTKETGIAVKVRTGEAPEIASQIIAEGSRSPADVYFTENSPELVLLDEQGLLAPVDPKTLGAVPQHDSAADGRWVGVLARENVLAYNPTKIAANALPSSLLALADPAWKGKVAIAPSDADFLPLVGAMVATKGRPATLAWLEGLRRNAQVFDDDEGVAAAVERGSVATGIINNYYWSRMATELGPDRTRSRVHRFAAGNIGALVNISGAGVLRAAPHPAAAQRFLAFLVSHDVQAGLGRGSVDFEYPLARGVAANPTLPPLDQLHPPAISVGAIGDDRLAGQLLRQAGLI